MKSKILADIDALAELLKDKKLDTDSIPDIQYLVQQATDKLENLSYETGPDHLLLKWGTWKSWNSDNKEIQKLIKKHDDLGLSLSAMSQKETDEQKEILCEIIDLIDGVIQNDWSGVYYTKSQAKDYIRGHIA